MASPSTWFRNVLLRMRFNRPHALHPGFLKVSAQGLELSRYRIDEGAIQVAPIWTFRWEDVYRILAFKRDVFGVGRRSRPDRRLSGPDPVKACP